MVSPPLPPSVLMGRADEIVESLYFKLGNMANTSDEHDNFLPLPLHTFACATNSLDMLSVNPLTLFTILLSVIFSGPTNGRNPFRFVVQTARLNNVNGAVA